MNVQDYLSTSEAARLLDVTPIRVRQLLKAGRLKFVATPLGRLIERESVLEYLATRKGSGKARP